MIIQALIADSRHNDDPANAASTSKYKYILICLLNEDYFIRVSESRNFYKTDRKYQGSILGGILIIRVSLSWQSIQRDSRAAFS